VHGLPAERRIETLARGAPRESLECCADRERCAGGEQHRDDTAPACRERRRRK
jgi:hypothetical protein